MQRFELSTTDTLKLTWEPLLIVRLAILKPYQYHTFALRIPLELDDDDLDLLKWEHLSWLRFARWRLIDCSPIRQDLETETTMDIEEIMVMEDPATTAEEPAITQIGRASCRERVYVLV